MQTVIVLLDLFTFLVGLSLGLYVFSRNPKSRIFQMFIVATLGMVGWNLTIFLLLAHIGPTLIIGKLSFSLATLMMTGFAWFIFIFPTKMRGWKTFSVIFALLGIVFFAVPLTPWFVTTVTVENGFIIGDLHPIIFPIWFFSYVISLLVVFFFLVGRTTKAVGVDKYRLRQILLGFSLFLFPMLVTNSFLPMFFQDFRFNNLGPAFSILLFIFLANAILSYRLLDIRWVFGKSIIFTILTVLVLWFVTTIYLFVSGLLTDTYTFLVTALLISISFEPLFHFLDKSVSRLINLGRYDAKKVTNEIFDIVRMEGDLSQLMTKINSSLEECLAATKIGVVILKTDTNKIVDSNIKGYSQTILKKVAVLATIAKERKFSIIEVGELKWQGSFHADHKQQKIDTKHMAQLNEVGVEVVIPLEVEKRLVGLIFLNRNHVSKILRSRDITFLELIRSGVSPAFENAAKFEEIKGLYMELSQLDKVKSEFIHVVSHRFRTPLSAIRWNLENALETSSKLDQETKLAIKDSHDRTIFLVKTLNRLFDTLAIESGKFKVELASFGARKAFAELIDRFAKMAREHKLKFDVSISPVSIMGDEGRIVEVCDHLLSNAVQYNSERGRVSFSVKRTNDHVEIRVSDSGIGIPSNEIDKIYDKFFRCRNAVLAYADGAGISLYIARHIVKLHKGDMTVESEVKKGTTVTVKLPVPSANKHRSRKAAKNK
ncbi:MAG: ATP-binding protein [Patescibacteria group bacterium]